ncbi:hypothetical protein R3P38DRAFT_3574915 [Favolaschia claudopus]|uniref:Uncharacterized protein n=1 Tax=Favolaschia claudopus TaxID=2862362 RepID=A0AAW0AL67_9AGAR
MKICLRWLPSLDEYTTASPLSMKLESLLPTPAVLDEKAAPVDEAPQECGGLRVMNLNAASLLLLTQYFRSLCFDLLVIRRGEGVCGPARYGRSSLSYRPSFCLQARDLADIFKRLCNDGDDGRPEEEREVGRQRWNRRRRRRTKGMASGAVRSGDEEETVTPAAFVVASRSSVAPHDRCPALDLRRRRGMYLRVLGDSLSPPSMSTPSASMSTEDRGRKCLRHKDGSAEIVVSHCSQKTLYDLFPVFLPASLPQGARFEHDAAGKFVDVARIDIESILATFAAAAVRTTVTATLVPITLWRRPLRSSSPALLSWSRDLSLPIRPSVYR